MATQHMGSVQKENVNHNLSFAPTFYQYLELSINFMHCVRRIFHNDGRTTICFSTIVHAKSTLHNFDKRSSPLRRVTDSSFAYIVLLLSVLLITVSTLHWLFYARTCFQLRREGCTPSGLPLFSYMLQALH